MPARAGDEPAQQGVEAATTAARRISKARILSAETLQDGGVCPLRDATCPQASFVEAEGSRIRRTETRQIVGWLGRIGGADGERPVHHRPGEPVAVG